MEWLIVACLGILIGFLISPWADRYLMPMSIRAAIGAIGALAGAGLVRMTGFSAFGAWTPYFAATMVALGLLAGAVLAYSLTRFENRS